MPHTTPHPVIAGAGFIADLHVRALERHGIQVAGVYDANLEVGAGAAARWGAPQAASLAELLATPGATHLHICVPPTRHEEVIAAGVAAGLDIVCEKPLAPTAGEARRIRDLIIDGGVRGYLTFNRRFDAGVQALRGLVADGTLGTPVTIDGSYKQQWNANPSSRDWRFDPELVGPSRVVVEIGSHWFDLAEHILGTELRQVNAYLAYMGERDYVQGADTGRFTPVNEDAFGAQLRYASGVVGQMFATQLAHGAWDDITVRIDGSLRSAWYDSRRPNQVFLAHKNEGVNAIGLASETDSIYHSIGEVYFGPETGRIGATLDAGVRSADTLDAVLASAASSSWTEVPA